MTTEQDAIGQQIKKVLLGVVEDALEHEGVLIPQFVNTWENRDWNEVIEALRRSGGFPFGTLDEGYCPLRDDELHCDCWWECEPCCACSYDGPDDIDCDCPRHSPELYDKEGELIR